MLARRALLLLLPPWLRALPLLLARRRQMRAGRRELRQATRQAWMGGAGQAVAAEVAGVLLLVARAGFCSRWPGQAACTPLLMI